MAIEEGYAAQGRIVADYVTAKSRLASLKNESVRLVRELRNLAGHLEAPEAMASSYDFQFLDAAAIKKLVDDLQATAREKQRLQSELHNLGVDVKEERNA